MASDADAPDSSPEAYLEQQARERGRRRLLAGGLLVAVLAVGAAGYAWMGRVDASRWDDTGRVFSELSTCVVGDPLAEGEKLRVRLRGIALALGANDVEAGHTEWPSRCKDRVHRFAEALTKTGRPDAKAVAATADALADTFDKRKPYPEARDVIDKLWTAAASVGLKASRVDGVEAPEAPVRALGMDNLDPAARVAGVVFDPSNMQREPFPAAAPRLLIDEKNMPGGPRLCDYAPDDKVLRCTTIPAPAADKSPKLRLWGTTEPGASPYVFAGRRGEEGIFRASDGRKLTDRLTYGATARKSGALQMTVWNADERHVDLLVMNVGDEQPLTKKVIDYERSGNPYYHTALFWDWFVYKDRDKDGVLRLYVRRVDERFSDWGEEIDVGPVNEPSLIDVQNDPPHFEACRTEATTVIRVRGRHNERLSFLHDGKWTTPVESPGIDGQLVCAGSEAVITRGGSQSRCTKDGCKSFSFQLPAVGEGQPRAFAEVGGKIAVVFKDGEHGGLRLRVAAPGEVDDEERIIFDDLLRDGDVTNLSTLLGVGIIPGRGYALVVLSVVGGNYVFHLAPSGLLTPVKAS